MATKNSGEIVPVERQKGGVEQLFKANMQAMVKAAPRTVGDPSRLIRVAYNAIFYDEKLRACSHKSLLAGVMESLKLGLTIGGPMQEAWLVPFNVRQRDGSMSAEATMIVGYQGFRNLIDRAKSVMDMQPQVVYSNDYFECELSEPRVTHRPWWTLGAAEPGEIIAAYVLVHLRGGGKQLTVLPRTEIESHQKRSRSGNAGPWVTDFAAMAMKTVIRVAAKYVPKASEAMQQLSRALELEDTAERGESQWGQFDPAAVGVQVFDQTGVVGGTEAVKALDALKGRLEASTTIPASTPTPEKKVAPAVSQPAADAATGLFEEI